MALVEILDVTVYKPIVEQLWNCYIDAPKTGTSIDVYAIDVVGWVLGRNSPVVSIELVHEGALFGGMPVHSHRPDIAAAYPEVPGAGSSGFRATVSVLGLTPEFELFVWAILQDKTRVPIGVIRGQRHSLRSDFQPQLQPLLLTSYGRTGSTWVMHLVGKHPQILTYRPFTFEPRVGRYWAEILKSLSEPRSYLQSVIVKEINDHWWLGDNNSSPEAIIPDLQIQQWLGRSNIETLAAFCRSRIEEFYNQVAVIQGQTTAFYFAEKYFPDNYTQIIRELYPQAREILLIRDFRDMICSILAFNAKRGYVAFGRELVNSDEDFVKRLRAYAMYVLNIYQSQPGYIHLLRYEDLILRPIETLTNILEYLNVDSTPATVECMLQCASQEISSMQQHLTSPDPQRSIGRWRHDLSASLQAACQEAFGEVLTEFGYSVD